MANRNVGIKKITPEIAKGMLAQNKVNRPLSDKWVGYYTRQLQAGSFVLNGQPVIFNKEGHLIDGQHRLSSIIKSGITAELVVVRGIENEAQTTIDVLKVRSAGDSFSLFNVPNAKEAAAITRLVWVWTRGLLKNLQSEKVSPDELLTTYKKEKLLIKEAIVYSQVNAKEMFIPKSVCGFIFWLIHTEGAPKQRIVSINGVPEFEVENEVPRFFEELATQPSGSLLTLRKRLAEDKVHRRRVSTSERIALFIKTWNAWLTWGPEQYVKKLQWSVTTESMPSIRSCQHPSD